MTQPRLRELAMELGVDKSTVSRALRGDPQIAAATADRIRRHAETRGYQRDPSLSALAEARWRGRQGQVRLNWGFLISERALRQKQIRIFSDFVQRYAARSGYALDVVMLRPDTTARELNRLIEARALRGLLVNPIYYHQAVAALDFSELRFESAAWVFCGEFYFEPGGHRVVENFFTNTLTALERIVQAGYGKIAFVYNPVIREARGPIRQRAATLEFARSHPGVKIRLVELNPGESAESIRRKVGAAEALLLARMVRPEHLPAALQKLPYATLSLNFGDTRRSGIRSVYEDLAMSAIDMLDFECRRYARGVPARRHTLVVEGEWQEGETLWPRSRENR